VILFVVVVVETEFVRRQRTGLGLVIVGIVHGEELEARSRGRQVALVRLVDDHFLLRRGGVVSGGEGIGAEGRHRHGEDGEDGKLAHGRVSFRLTAGPKRDPHCRHGRQSRLSNP